MYLLVGAALAGFGQGSNNTLLGVLLLDAVPDDQKRKNILGIAISAMSLGGVFFTTVGGFLAVNHWQHAYYLWFIIVLFIVLEFVCLPNRKPEGSKQPAADTQASEPAGKLPVMVWIIAIHYLFWFMFMYVYGLNVSEYVITLYQLGTSAESGIAASLVTVGGVVAGHALRYLLQIPQEMDRTVRNGSDRHRSVPASGYDHQHSRHLYLRSLRRFLHECSKPLHHLSPG